MLIFNTVIVQEITLGHKILLACNYPYCPLYDDIRDQLTLSINDINPSLQDSSVQDQLIQLMSNPIYYRVVSKAICYILDKRRLIVYR